MPRPANIWVALPYSRSGISISVFCLVSTRSTSSFGTLSTETAKTRVWMVGPFRVIEKCSEVLYRIRNMNTGHTRVVRVDKLRPFHGDPGVCEGFRDGVADSIAGSVDDSTERPMHEEELQLPSLSSTDEDNEDRRHTGRRPRRTPAYLDDFIVGCAAMDGELPNVWNGVDRL